MVRTPQFTGENIGHALANLAGDVARKLAETNYRCNADACTIVAIEGEPVLTATEDEEYTGFTVTADGGWTPYVFSVAGGSLPPGITLNASSGVVAGTPTTAGVYAGIIIRVTDASNATDDLDAFTITVAE